MSALSPSKVPSFFVIFITATAIAFGLLTAWSLASPAMASPDEPAHAAKAAATVRGQLFADETGFNPGRGNFELPRLFDIAWKLPCFAFNPDMSADCVPDIEGNLDTVVPVTSHVERYNPVYYAIVGLPTLLPLSEWTFTAMRIVGAFLNAVLVGAAAATIATTKRPFFPALGLIAAVSPMALFIGGSITPQGPEIFGSLLVASALYALVFDPDTRLLPLRAWMMAGGTVIAAMSRGLSPVFIALIVLLAVAVAPSIQSVGRVARDKRFLAPLVVSMAACAAAAVYTVASGALAMGVPFPDDTLTSVKVVTTMIGNTSYYLEQVLGTFGWGDVHLSLWVLMLIAANALALGLLSLAASRWRTRLVLLVFLAVCLVLPIALQLVSFHESGLVWQGKYILPLASALVLACGFVAADTVEDTPLGAKILRVGVVVAAVAHIAAFVTNVRRYTSGASASWSDLGDASWQPPLTWVVLSLATTVVWVALIVVVVGWSRRVENQNARIVGGRTDATLEASVPRMEHP